LNKAVQANGTAGMCSILCPGRAGDAQDAGLKKHLHGFARCCGIFCGSSADTPAQPQPSAWLTMENSCMPASRTGGSPLHMRVTWSTQVRPSLSNQAGRPLDSKTSMRMKESE
jgi:hypothetical protein